VGQYEFEGPASLAWERWFEDTSAVSFTPSNLAVFAPGTGAGDRVFQLAFRSLGTESPVAEEVLSADAATGAEQWRASVDLPQIFDRYPKAVVSADGTRLFLGGQASEALSAVAYETAGGQLLWPHTLDKPPGETQEFLLAMGAGADGGRIFLSGLLSVSLGGPTFHYLVTAGLDADTGQTVWSDVYPAQVQGTSNGKAFAVNPDGSRVFVATAGFGEVVPMLVVAYDAATGQRVWEVSHAAPGGSATIPVRMGVSPDGTRVVVTGTTYLDGWPSPRLWAFDAATGALQWTGYSAGDEPQVRVTGPHDLVISSDGRRVFVLSDSQTSWADLAPLVEAYDAASGETLWFDFYKDPTNPQFSYSNAVAISPDGNLLFVDETMYHDSTFTRVVIAYHAPTGLHVWRAAGSLPIVGQFGIDPLEFALAPDGSRLYLSGEESLNNQPQKFPVVAYNTCDPTFSDVDCTNALWPFVEIVNTAGVASGFPDGTFRPALGVTRGQMAVFLARVADRAFGDFAAYQPPACGAKSFADVPCSHPQYKFIEYIASKGIAAGFPDGSYRPGAGVNRGAMAVFLARTRNLADGDFDSFAPPGCGTEPEHFADVACTHPLYKFVEYILSKQITSGNGNGTYGIGNGVTRGQIAVFITRTGNLGK